MVQERPRVTLYGRPGCHLCAAAESDLRRLAPTLAFELELVDIESSDELLRRYLLEIPVVAFAGRELLRAPFSAATLRETLEAALGAQSRK